MKKYTIRNLNDSIDCVTKNIISEDELISSLNSFSSPQNLDVQKFLRKNAIEFTKKGQSVTYLVYDSDTSSLVGYYTLTIKPITIALDNFSNTSIKRLQRLSDIDENRNSITISAYLIAQLGKNYAIPKDQRIGGADLLSYAYATICSVKREIGGVVVLLECEDNPFLLDFYNTLGHINIGARITGNGQMLHQYLKFV